MNYFIYIIKSKEGYVYTGMTDNLNRRLLEHNSKSLSFWTKRGTDWKLIYLEKFSEKFAALKKERWLKTGVGREFLTKILKQD